MLIPATVAVALAAILSASGNYREAAVLAAAGLGAGVLVAGPISVRAVLITWFATAPLSSFYIRFPTDRSIITYDRGVFALIIVMLLLKPRSAPLAQTTGKAESSLGNAVRRTALSVSKFEAAWALLSFLALASAVASSNDLASAMRIAIDTFWLPLLAFHVARNYVDLRNGGRLLLLGGIALALFLFAAGAYEVVTGADLFAYKGSEILREGERRVNGPFAADSSFAIICLMLFLFLLAAARLFRVRFDRTGKIVYVCAVTASALGALLPLFRGVAFALAAGWIVLKWSDRQSRWSLFKNPGFRRGKPIGVFILLLLFGLVGWTIAPSLVANRLTDARTAYGRFATWQAAAEIAFDNPVLGVGLTNYADHFDATHYYSDEPPEEVLETRAADSPHSNVLWIGAELGLTGLALYFAANAYLFLIGWRALKRAVDSRQRTAALCFLALVVAYWIPGLTLASGYYSDLNLYFLFLLGALSNSSLATSSRRLFHG